MKSNIIKQFSPAKLNLYLSVIGRRKDGYHNLESMMTFCDYGDQIKIKKAKSFSLKIDGDFGNTSLIKNNIILKTVNEIEKRINQKIILDIKLTKNLPISSGMGGGSSNAANLLKCIINLYDIKFKEKELNDLLLSLGADVPFCYYSRTGVVSGIGEIIRFTKKIPEYYVLLVNPLVEISTKLIFNSINIEKNKKEEINEDNLISFLRSKKNDLEVSAIIQCNQIKSILKTLKNTNSLLTRMTGSGATCFSLFKDKKDLNEADKIVDNLYPKFWKKKTKILNQF